LYFEALTEIARIVSGHGLVFLIGYWYVAG
jgi:hypothetical protein